MKEKNKIIIAIVAVVAIVLIVVGATYAYWQWTTNSAQESTVNLVVPTADQQLKATLTGADTTVANLAPTNNCTGTYTMTKKITITNLNQTQQAASLKLTLKISSWTQSITGTADTTKLHYALTESATNCTTAAEGVSGYVGTFPANAGVNTVLINNLELKTVPAGTTSTSTNYSKDYYLHVWLDSTYTNTGSLMNEGNTINDPMQNLSFTLTWTGSISTATS